MSQVRSCGRRSRSSTKAVGETRADGPRALRFKGNIYGWKLRKMAKHRAFLSIFGCRVLETSQLEWCSQTDLLFFSPSWLKLWCHLTMLRWVDTIKYIITRYNSGTVNSLWPGVLKSHLWKSSETMNEGTLKFLRGYILYSSSSSLWGAVTLKDR